MIITKQHVVVPVLVVSDISSDVYLVWPCRECDYVSKAQIDKEGNIKDGVRVEIQGIRAYHDLKKWYGADEYMDKISRELNNNGSLP